MKSLHRLLHAFIAVLLTSTLAMKAENVRATIRAVDQDVELRFNTVTDRHYEILDSTTLTDWKPVVWGIPGNGGEVVRFYPTAGVPKRFFQVVAVSVPAGFAPISAGGFTMGNSIVGDDMSDAPPHLVTVSAFYMARNLVTKVEWDTVRSWAVNNGYSDLAVGAGKAGNHPVQAVSWWDCVKYCNARSQQEKLTPVYTVGGAVMKTGTTAPAVNWSANGYRLPTEAEWEKAARGGLVGQRFPWGVTINHDLADFSNNGGESYQSGTTGPHPLWSNNDDRNYPYTSPVGSFAANGFGVNDMAGNVWQWCWDWRGDYDIGSPADPRGPSSGQFRVIRGGSWNDYAELCRVAYRNATDPENTSDTFGFRVARSSVR